jgi:hypothetical protein
MRRLVKLLRKLFHRLSRHRPRRDEDLQGRPSGPEVEATRARVQEVYVRRYADRTKERGTPRRKHFDNRRRSYMRSHWSPRGSFGNPRWMRAEGVTPFGISSRTAGNEEKI